MQGLDDAMLERGQRPGMAPLLVDNLPAIQARLREDGLGAWLLHDFRGSNPTASNALGLEGLMVTRRILYLIPAEGLPSFVCHAMDLSNLPPLPGRQDVYTGWRDLDRILRKALRGMRRVAMEYFPGGAIPYLSRVDGGTLEWVRSMGVEIVPSADLVQHFLCRFTPGQAEAHRAAVRELDGIKDRALELVERRLQVSYAVTEYEVQQFIMEELTRAGMVTDHPPIVSAGSHTADPHYVPSADGSADIGPGDLLMLVLWGRHCRPVCAYGDITWMAHVGDDPPERALELFDLVVRARDTGLELVHSRYRPGVRGGLEGWQVDRAVRDVIEARGYGASFPHRTGHNVGAHAGHGDGTHIDDLETHDTRPLVQGLCFTLEPGIYLEDELGVRTGIDVYLGPDCPEVNGTVQRELVLLGGNKS